MHYHPIRIILSGGSPFNVKSLELDFPIEIIGDGKVCLIGDEDDPVINISSCNVRLRNLTIRHRNYDDVSAVKIEKGNALIEKCAICSEGHCVYVEPEAEAYIDDSIMHNGKVGIKVGKKAHVTAENCLITKNKNGVFVAPEGTIRVPLQSSIVLISY